MLSTSSVYKPNPAYVERLDKEIYNAMANGREIRNSQISVRVIHAGQSPELEITKVADNANALKVGDRIRLTFWDGRLQDYGTWKAMYVSQIPVLYRHETQNGLMLGVDD